MDATRAGALARYASPPFIRSMHGGILAAAIFALLATDASSPGFRDLVPQPEEPQPSVQLEAQPSPVNLAATEPRAHAPSLSPGMQRVRDYVARRYKVSGAALEPVLGQTEHIGHKLGIDPLLIVSIMAIESRFNPLAESASGAQGLMQVIPRFHLDKFDPREGVRALFDPETNIRVGTLVLKEGLQRFGSLQAGLQYYGGALSDPNAEYANKVLALKARLKAIANPGAEARRQTNEPAA